MWTAYCRVVSLTWCFFLHQVKVSICINCTWHLMLACTAVNVCSTCTAVQYLYPMYNVHKYVLYKCVSVCMCHVAHCVHTHLYFMQRLQLALVAVCLWSCCCVSAVYCIIAASDVGARCQFWWSLQRAPWMLLSLTRWAFCCTYCRLREKGLVCALSFDTCTFCSCCRVHVYNLQERVCTKVQYITLCVHVLVHCVHSQVSVVVYTMHIYWVFTKGGRWGFNL